MTCPQTGYYAEIDFLTKPFFGGKPHKITGNIYRPCFKKPIMILKGEWNGVITAKPLSGDEFIFIDVKEKDEVKKVDLFVFFSLYCVRVRFLIQIFLRFLFMVFALV